MTIAIPDFHLWRSWKVSKSRFDQRREKYFRYVQYDDHFDDMLGGIDMVTTDLPKHLAKARAGGLMMSTQQRLWDTFDWMSCQYSAGAPVEQLRDIWPHVLEWAEEYGRFDEAYNNSAENTSGDCPPHVALVSEEYWIVALRFVCFGLLTGHAAQMPRVMTFIDYANADLNIYDGLLERLVAPFTTERPAPPDTATRHLPYRKLFKTFAAAPEQRPALMVKYLDEWYHASRREPYVDQHGEGDVIFYGYWSWEAAAVTWLLGIDDATYREMPFYPRDLADYAKAFPITPDGKADAPRTDRIPAGELCPRTGWWFTPAQTNSRRHFKQGDVFPDITDSDYGATFWQWSPDQAMPSLS